MSPKNMKRVKTLEDDWISSLPDDLLCRILSFLPAKHSVATTTRWTNVFASVPGLDFDDSLESFGNTNTTAFISFVERTIVAVLNKLSHVRKFRLKCEKGYISSEMVSSWIYYVSSRNLYELCISAKNLTNPQYLPSKLLYYEFLLNAPGLEFFSYDNYATKGYFGDKLNYIVNANIDIELEDEKVSQLVNMVSNARSLVLMSDSLEASVGPDLMFVVFPLSMMRPTETFLNLTELKVETHQVGGWLSLPNLLRSTPFLEVLSFENGLHDENGDFLEPASYLPEPAPICVSDHLKEVEVGCFHGEEYEFELVKYFLKNAKVLKKMIISPSPSCHSLNQRVCEIASTKKQFPITWRLLKLPRRSRACQINFDDVLF